MFFFISDAAAAGATAAGQAPQPNSAFSLVMILSIFVLFYFMILRPQQKRAKEHRGMINELKKGDEVITSGGILGKIVDLNEQYMKIAIADGVEINMQRGAIAAVLPKGTLKSL